MYFTSKDRILCAERFDTATVLGFDENKLVLKWDDYGMETFLLNNNGIYEFTGDINKFTENSEKINNEIVLASHGAWSADWQPQELQYISSNKIMRLETKDVVLVKNHTDTELILDWYSYGEERFIKDEDGVYSFQEGK